MEYPEFEKLVRSAPPHPAVGAFDPRVIEAMATAFRAVCASLALAEQDDPVTRTVARKVIEIAGTGVQEPDRIAGLALLALREPPPATRS
jgi:hypothetical protein